MLTEVRDGVATLTLNNPDERNTLTRPMVEEILSAMDDFESDDSVGALVVTGSAPAFCAGANLGNLSEATGESLGNIYEGFLRIARSPLPTLAAINGAAVGAGANLALGCDVRIIADEARIDTRFLNLGIHPGGGHTWMLRRIAGPQTAMAAVVFGQVLGGKECERVGLAYRSVPRAELADFAQEFAAEVRNRWNSDEIRENVILTQKQRRAVHAAMEQGLLTSWDYNPPRDASQEYVRNHMDWTVAAAKTRFPPLTE